MTACDGSCGIPVGQATHGHYHVTNDIQMPIPQDGLRGEVHPMQNSIGMCATCMYSGGQHAPYCDRSEDWRVKKKVLQEHTMKVGIEPVRGQIGSGALPVDLLPSFAIAVRAKGLDRLAADFRRLPIPVIGRISEGTLYFDLRTLDDEAAFAAQLDKLDVVAG